MYRLLFLISMLLYAAPVWPGAWLREEDTSFSAAAATVFKDPYGGYEYTTSLYAEWGTKPNLTVGLDFEEHRDAYGHALVFARVPVADYGAWGRFAAEFGAGVHHRQKRAWALYKVGLSYGKGFQTGWGNGWVAVDSALEYRTHDAVFRKLDLTVGLSSQGLLNPLLQIETSYSPKKSLFWRARPSIMIRIPDSPSTWVLGFERNDARSDTGLKLALWNEF